MGDRKHQRPYEFDKLEDPKKEEMKKDDGKGNAKEGKGRGVKGRMRRRRERKWHHCSGAQGAWRRMVCLEALGVLGIVGQLG